MDRRGGLQVLHRRYSQGGTSASASASESESASESGGPQMKAGSSCSKIQREDEVPVRGATGPQISARDGQRRDVEAPAAAA